MGAYVFAFAAGVLFLQSYSGLPESLWIYASGAFVFFLIKTPKLACFFLGFVWASMYSDSVLTDRLLSELEGQDIVVEGYVEGLPQQFERGVRFNFNPKKVNLPQTLRLPTRIRLSWYYPSTTVKPGKSGT